MHTFNHYLLGLSEQKDTDDSPWRATKGLKRSKTHVPAIKNIVGTWVKSHKQTATLFANTFEQIFQPLPRQTSNENTTIK